MSKINFKKLNWFSCGVLIIFRYFQNLYISYCFFAHKMFNFLTILFVGLFFRFFTYFHFVLINTYTKTILKQKQTLLLGRGACGLGCALVLGLPWVVLQPDCGRFACGLGFVLGSVLSEQFLPYTGMTLSLVTPALHTGHLFEPELPDSSHWLRHGQLNSFLNLLM